MGFIFASGTRFARLIAASAILAAVALAGSDPVQGSITATSPVDLTVRVSGLKNNRGQLRYCVAPRGASFPQCAGHGAISGSAEITRGETAFVIRGLSPGSYAVAVFHDQNANNRLDTMIGIPREGYGFSRNPSFKPRAPRFDEAALDLSQSTHTEIHMRYIL